MLHITGAGGWIGSALLRTARVRGGASALDCRAGTGSAAEWSWLGGAVVVHAAAIAHRGPGQVGADDYRRVNCDLAVAVARAAARAGAARFVFVSSAAVMGTTSSHPWSEADPPAPVDAYARAKWEAEQRLGELHVPGSFDVVVIRPPLVWGRGARANFQWLLRAARSPWPLPLARARAPRSMVYLGNVVSAIEHLARAPAGRVGGRAFFVSDGHDMSVADWIAAIRRRRGCPPRLFGMPEPLLKGLAIMAGRRGAHQRLFGPAQVDDSALRATGWRPPYSVEDGLRCVLAEPGFSREADR